MRTHLVAWLGVFLGVIALAYFAFIAARPTAFARILLRRRYGEQGWTEERLAARVRLLGIVGTVAALAVILLAIVKMA